MVGIFILTYFALMLFFTTPLIFAIGATAFTVPLFYGGAFPAVNLTFIAETFTKATFANNTGLTIILFIISGNIMTQGAMTEKIFNMFAFFLGRKRGFLPILATLTCMLYGAISGSGPATTAAVGAMCYPILVSMGYDRFFSAGLLVVSGCLGMVIPPSIPVTNVNACTGLDLIVLYKLAAVVGVIAGLMICIGVYLFCRITNAGDQQKINQWVDDLRSQGFVAVMKDSIWALLTPVVILGSIFSGFADTAQAAAISVIYGLFVSIVVYKSLKVSDILPMLKSSLKNSASMLIMLGFINVFQGTLTAMDVNTTLTTFVNNSGITPVILMFIIMVYQFIMGSCGAGSSVTVVIPIAYPLMMATGLEPFTACMVCVVMQAISLCTPPVGLCLFAMTGMAKCDVTDLAKWIYPLVGIMLLVALMLVFFPGAFSFITAGAVIPPA